MAALLHVISTIRKINNWTIIHLPQAISQELPSRGMNMGRLEIDDVNFIIALEPDGEKGHWFKVDEEMLASLSPDKSGHVSFSLEILTTWVKPQCPKSMMERMQADQVLDIWDELTAKAQWEWIRWIRSTSKEATRMKRINTMCSMLIDGKKRPCCFNSQQCTEASIAKNGILL